MKALVTKLMFVLVALCAACSGQGAPDASGGGGSAGTADASLNDANGQHAQDSSLRQPDVSSACLTDAACLMDDAPSCHRGICVDGACVTAPVDDHTPCDDENPCTTETHCETGTCRGGRATTCTDDDDDDAE